MGQRNQHHPGSLAFYLWEAAGTSFTALLDEMLSLAFKRAREREALTFTYESNILSGVSLGGSKGGKAVIFILYTKSRQPCFGLSDF